MTGVAPTLVCSDAGDGGGRGFSGGRRWGGLGSANSVPGPQQYGLRRASGVSSDQLRPARITPSRSSARGAPARRSRSSRPRCPPRLHAGHRGRDELPRRPPCTRCRRRGRATYHTRRFKGDVVMPGSAPSTSSAGPFPWQSSPRRTRPTSSLASSRPKSAGRTAAAETATRAGTTPRPLVAARAENAARGNAEMRGARREARSAVPGSGGRGCQTASRSVGRFPCPRRPPSLRPPRRPSLLERQSA